MTTERMEVQRTIKADPAAIFEVLCDPMGHVAIDSSGMLIDATGDRVTAVGDTFVVHPQDLDALQSRAGTSCRNRFLSATERQVALT